MDFSNKNILITGAGRGIGAAIAYSFASYGASVIINYYQSKIKANGLADQLRSQFKSTVYTFQADVSNEYDVEKMFSFAKEKLSTIDILVNNAGIVARGKLDQITIIDWDRVIDTNLKGVFLCSKAATQSMLHDGTIINIASMRGFTGSTDSLPYAASKAGVIALTKSLALELAPRIRVNCVAPGYTLTDLHSTKSKSQINNIERNIPMGHFAQAKDIANVVVFLASEFSSHITGETILVSGGEVMK